MLHSLQANKKFLIFLILTYLSPAGVGMDDKDQESNPLRFQNTVNRNSRKPVSNIFNHESVNANEIGNFIINPSLVAESYLHLFEENKSFREKIEVLENNLQGARDYIQTRELEQQSLNKKNHFEQAASPNSEHLPLASNSFGYSWKSNRLPDQFNDLENKVYDLGVEREKHLNRIRVMDHENKKLRQNNKDLNAKVENSKKDLEDREKDLKNMEKANNKLAKENKKFHQVIEKNQSQSQKRDELSVQEIKKLKSSLKLAKENLKKVEEKTKLKKKKYNNTVKENIARIQKLEKQFTASEEKIEELEIEYKLKDTLKAMDGEKFSNFQEDNNLENELRQAAQTEKMKELQEAPEADEKARQEVNETHKETEKTLKKAEAAHSEEWKKLNDELGLLKGTARKAEEDKDRSEKNLKKATTEPRQAHVELDNSEAKRAGTESVLEEINEQLKARDEDIRVNKETNKVWPSEIVQVQNMADLVSLSFKQNNIQGLSLSLPLPYKVLTVGHELPLKGLTATGTDSLENRLRHQEDMEQELRQMRKQIEWLKQENMNLRYYQANLMLSKGQSETQNERLKQEVVSLRTYKKKYQELIKNLEKTKSEKNKKGQGFNSSYFRYFTLKTGACDQLNDFEAKMVVFENRIAE